MSEEFNLSEKRHDFRLINLFMYDEKDVKEFIERRDDNLGLFLCNKISARELELRNQKLAGDKLK